MPKGPKGQKRPADVIGDIEDIVALIDAVAPKPGPRGPYKKDISK